MRIRVYYNQKWLRSSWLPEFLRCEAVVLYPFILFCEPKDRIAKTTVRHEIIHVRQAQEIGPLRFDLLYNFHILKGLIRYWSWERAYRENPYEKEAYRKQKWITLTAEEKKVVGWE